MIKPLNWKIKFKEFDYGHQLGVANDYCRIKRRFVIRMAIKRNTVDEKMKTILEEALLKRFWRYLGAE